MPPIRAIDKKIGQILIENGRLTEEKLQSALDLQKEKRPKDPLGSILIDLGHIREEDVTFVLGIQFNLPVVDVTSLDINLEAVKQIPEAQAKKLEVMPLLLVGNELTVAIHDPTRIDVLDHLKRQTRYTVQPVLTTQSQILTAQAIYYAKLAEAQAPANDGSKTSDADQAAPDARRLEAKGKEIPIINIVNQILNQAIEEGASDIHVEPQEQGLLIRYRVDGRLREISTYPFLLQAGIISRLKILASLDIAERQQPQDGRIQLTVGKKTFDFRVSTLPASFGEKVVLRILDRGSVLIPLDTLGFSPTNLENLTKLINRPYGILLVTGPTGSGKSTTLYSVLNTLRAPDVNIITVEDPVEYRLPGINQVQVNPKKQLNFASALRSILRQDPDIIMIGEIRDPETGKIATEAALTGHMVFSTLHTNDACGAVTRLIEMGIDPFLVAPSLLGIIAQRLVLRICNDCKEFYEPRPSELARLGLDHTDVSEVRFAKGRGCQRCKQRGFRGRVALHELLVIDDTMRQMISDRASHSELLRYATSHGFYDMRIDGIRKLAAGLTTIEEVLRETKE
jgi:type IV pilus assembly protein PilB